jgi:hypothetical protein
VAQEMLSSYKGKQQPGTYILSTSMTPDEMMEILARENTEGQPDQTNTGGKAKEGSSEIQDGSSSSPKETDESSQDEGGEQS